MHVGQPLSLTCDDASLPVDETNLVMKAVQAYRRHQPDCVLGRFHLTKKIPHGAGLGGGSSDAAATLRGLSARTHRVITAVAVALGDEARLAVSVSRVSFAEIDEAALARYVAGGEPFGKAGAYAIQGAASAWVRRIDGSYSGIMGLPLYETAQLLRSFGVRC